jgi:LacI family transcriptional regulator
VLQALEQKRLLGVIQVITTDLFPELIRHIESRKVLATIYQRPFTQGKVAFETLIRFLVEGVKPSPSTKLAPHIVLRSNLSLFLNHVSGPDETVGAG